MSLNPAVAFNYQHESGTTLKPPGKPGVDVAVLTGVFGAGRAEQVRAKTIPRLKVQPA